MILGSPRVGKTAFVNALLRAEGQKPKVSDWFVLDKKMEAGWFDGDL